MRRRRLALIAGVLIAMVACAAVILRLRSTDEDDALRPIPVPVDEPAGDIDTASVEARLLTDPAVRWVGTFDGDPWDDKWGFNFGEAGTGVAAEVPGVGHGQVLDVAFNPDDLEDRTTPAARIAMNRLAAFPLDGHPPVGGSVVPLLRVPAGRLGGSR